eukprot:scaffold21435_cov35-Prasinocladus_malaysianus.AAC.1
MGMAYLQARATLIYLTMSSPALSVITCPEPWQCTLTERYMAAVPKPVDYEYHPDRTPEASSSC